MHAYVSARALRRKSLTTEPRHAVDEMSHLCGALDTYCGKPVAIRVGEWEPDHPNNCQRCARALAKELGSAA
jgi:hypothetical protein